MNLKQLIRLPRRAGFTLIEVVLALGIFLVTVLALVGLLGPTLKSVDVVDKTDETISVVNSVNAFLQGSPDIARGASRFNAIFNAVANDGYATVIVYRRYDDSDPSNFTVRQEIGFVDNEGGNIDAEGVINSSGAVYQDAAGPIYRVVLSASSVTPSNLRSAARSAGIYTITDPIVANYPEGYLALEVRIFAMESDMVAITGTLPTPTIAQLENEEPIFTYNTAIVR